MHKPVKKNILIIILAIIVLGLGGLSFLVYQYTRETEATLPSSASTPKSTATKPTTDSTPSQDSSTPTSDTTTDSTNKDKMMVKIFLIEMNDNGKSGTLVGCGDSAIAVLREVPQTQAVLKVAIEQLLSLKDKDYGQSGYYNALYQSNLTLDSAEISNSKATIKLSGTVSASGTCDNPRLIAQLEETAKQFSAVKEVEILVNNKNIQSVLSEEG